MKFLLPTVALLLADVVLASPLAAKALARGLTTTRRRTHVLLPAPATGITEGTNAQTSSNWAGAVITSSNVTEVTGTFIVPKPTPPSGGSSSTQYCGAAWVGIDGDSCQSGLIQTGVFWCVQNGATSYEAWYEYIPAASVAFSGITVSAGNEIKVTVTRTGAHGGVTTLENVSTGVTKSHTFTNDNQGTLCGANAEWIVEDFEEGSSLVPFADFGTVTFSGSSYIAGGKTLTPGSGGAEEIVLNQGSGALTSTTISGGTVTVKYV